MSRFVAAVVTVIDGHVKAKADPRISDTANPSLELACMVDAARWERAAGIAAVERAGDRAWDIHQERRGEG